MGKVHSEAAAQRAAKMFAENRGLRSPDPVLDEDELATPGTYIKGEQLAPGVFKAKRKEVPPPENQIAA